MHDVLKARELIPAAALESHIGVLGKTGSGKSNLAKVIAEGLMSAGERVCAVDPTGTWWGLRLAVDGKKPSPFTPIIFGGDHGDIPLGEQHGAVLAEAVGTSADSAVIDTQQMTVGQRTRFFAAFAEGLLRFNRGPLHLIIDEAHLFAPQGKVNDPQSGAMLHAANNLVSLGRGRGLRIILISQRPAKLHKDSLTQVETLIAMRLIAPQDRAAVKDWVGEWADADKGREIIASLPSLPRGDTWVWSPQINYLERKSFPLAATYDSGTAEANSSAKALPTIDLAKIGARMDTIRQEALANDPKRLKARIAELEKAKPATAPAVDTALLEQMNYKKGYEEGARAGAAFEAERLGKKLVEFAGQFAAAPAEPGSIPPPPRNIVAKVAPPRQGEAKPVAAQASSEFSGPQIKVIRALSMWKALGKSQPTKAMVGMIAGYATGGSTLRNILSELRTAGAIDYPAAGLISLLAEAIDMTPEEGKQMFLSNFTGPQRKIVDTLDRGEMSKDDLGAATGYEPAGSTLRNILSELRTLGVIDYPAKGRVALEAWTAELV